MKCKYISYKFLKLMQLCLEREGSLFVINMDASSWRELIRTLLQVCLFCLCVQWFWKQRHLYRFALKFPGYIGMPLIGPLMYFTQFKYAIDGFNRIFNNIGSQTVWMWMGFYPTMITTDPTLVEKILTSPHLLTKSVPMYAVLHDALQGGIATSSVNRWRYIRKHVSPSFSHQVLLSFLPVFNRIKKSFIARLDEMTDNREHCLSILLNYIAAEASVETTMGTEGIDDKQLKELVHTFQYVLSCSPTSSMLSFGKLKFFYALQFKFQDKVKQLNEFVEKTVRRKMKRNNIGSVLKSSDTDSVRKSSNIFIDQAIKMYHRKIFSLHDIIAESNTIVGASFETTANAIFSTLTMLATHPEIQERLFNEIVSIFPNNEFDLEYGHMQQLPYMDMVIQESLRLAPPVPIIGRETTMETKLTSELSLPKGLQICIPIYHMQRHPNIWGPNANKFDPDNFLPENLTGIHPYGFLPFSKGSRNCIGWRYGLFFMKVILAGLVRNYRFETSTKYEDLRSIFCVALKYETEPRFKIYKRE